MTELQIKLTPEEVKYFEAISQSESGKVLLGYLTRLKGELFSPKSLTKENFDARKDAVEIIEKLIEAKIGFTKAPEVEINPYV